MTKYISSFIKRKGKKLLVLFIVKKDVFKTMEFHVLVMLFHYLAKQKRVQIEKKKTRFLQKERAPHPTKLVMICWQLVYYPYTYAVWSYFSISIYLYYPPEHHSTHQKLNRCLKHLSLVGIRLCSNITLSRCSTL